MTRIITAVIGIPILIYVVEFAPVVVCVSVIFAAMLVALYEYFVLTAGNGGSGSLAWPGYLIASAITLSFYFTNLNLHLFFPLGAALVLIVALFSRRDVKTTLQSSAVTLFGAWYLGGLMGYLIGLRMIDSGGEAGSDLLMMLFVMIWAGDTFAYFFGKKFGRHKLAAVVSPKKTIEGAIAGFVFSVLAAIASRSLFAQQQLSLLDAMILGGLVGITGQIGDLCESILKRSANVKDSGAILPGHGGMLDRVDSLLFGAPTIYYYFYLFLQK